MPCKTLVNQEARKAKGEGRNPEGRPQSLGEDGYLKSKRADSRALRHQRWSVGGVRVQDEVHPVQPGN
jgi:hypothetical protein